MGQRHYKVNRFEVRASLNSSISDYLEHVTYLFKRDYFLNSELEIIVPLPYLSYRVILRVK